MTVLPVGSQTMDVDGLADDIFDRHTRIKARVRILEYDLHLTAVRKHIHMRDILAVIENRSIRRFI